MSLSYRYKRATKRVLKACFAQCKDFNPYTARREYEARCAWAKLDIAINSRMTNKD